MIRRIVQFQDGYFIKYLVNGEQLKKMFCIGRNCQLKSHISAHGKPVAFFNLKYHSK